jgi:hypothetical protein
MESILGDISQKGHNAKGKNHAGMATVKTALQWLKSYGNQTLGRNAVAPPNGPEITVSQGGGLCILGDSCACLI